MALFQKKPNVSNSAPLYTLGLQKTMLLVGLGNPGKEFDGTRHNIGFTVVNEFAKKFEFAAWIEKKDLRSFITTHTIGDARIILAKPTTFMNLSGNAVQTVIHFYKVPLEQVIVVHDELDIPFGQIRSKLGGGDAGHNGVKSLIEQIGPDFGRVRIGIHNDIADRADGKDFVLGKFNEAEQAQLTALLKETNSILSEYVHGQPLTAETRSFLI